MFFTACNINVLRNFELSQDFLNGSVDFSVFLEQCSIPLSIVYSEEISSVHFKFS